ncbi:MAG: hypothetical protein ABL901_03860 [Hyphomicrobiaceae bacterium]
MSVRMPPELRQQVEQAAITAGMSLSAYIADTLAKASLPRPAGAVPVAAEPVYSTLPHRERGQAPISDERVNRPVNTAANGSVVNPQPQALQPVAGAVAYIIVGLRLIGSDINQIAHTINSGMPADSGKLVRVLRRLRDLFEIEGVFGSVMFDQKATDERGRIANNLNQISQAGPRALPAIVQELVQGYLALLAAANAHDFCARLTVVQQWHQSNDSPHPQARQQLQDGGAIRPARPAAPTFQPRPRPAPPEIPDGKSGFLDRLLKS